MTSGSRDPLRLVHDEGLELTEVTAHVRSSPFRGHLVALSLTFGRVTCVVVAEQDDSLTVWPVWTADPDLSPVILSHQEPWSLVLGRPLMWSWSMTNQQGYRDALQFEFAQEPGVPTVLIQLVALGSEVRLRRVDAAFAPHPAPVR